MEKIERYIDRFFKKTEIRNGYDMHQEEWHALYERAKEDRAEATGKAFLFGYAKGYRAAMAEMKKRGGMAV